MHCITCMHVRRIDLLQLANDFCKSCNDEKEEETLLHLVGTCSVLCCAYNMYDLEELSGIGSLSSFIKSSEWF